MREELEKKYIESKTKNWDEETYNKYLYEVKEDFKVFYEGYFQALKLQQAEIDRLKEEISLLKEKQKEVSVAFSKWWGLCNPNMFKETDTIFDAFDLFTQTEQFKQIIK